MSKYECNACPEAEGCYDPCVLILYYGEPEFCPLTGEECDWTEKSKQH